MIADKDLLGVDFPIGKCLAAQFSRLCCSKGGGGDPVWIAAEIYKFILAPSNFVKLKSMTFFLNFKKATHNLQVTLEIR